MPRAVQSWGIERPGGLREWKDVLSYFSGMDCLPPWTIVLSANGACIIADLRAALAIRQAVDPAARSSLRFHIVRVALEVVDDDDTPRS